MVWVGWEYDIPADVIGIEVPSVPGIDNSALAGLGLAAVRDVATWIKQIFGIERSRRIVLEAPDRPIAGPGRGSPPVAG